MWEETVEHRKGSVWMRIKSWWGCKDKDLDVAYQFL